MTTLHNLILLNAVRRCEENPDKTLHQVIRESHGFRLATGQRALHALDRVDADWGNLKGDDAVAALTLADQL